MTTADRIAHTKAQVKVLSMQAMDLRSEMPSIIALAQHVESTIRIGETEAMDDAEILNAMRGTLDLLKTRLARIKVLSDSIQGCEYRLFSENAK